MRSPCLKCDRVELPKVSCLANCEELEEWRKWELEDRVALRCYAPLVRVRLCEVRQGPTTLRFFNVPQPPERRKPKLQIVPQKKKPRAKIPTSRTKIYLPMWKIPGLLDTIREEADREFRSVNNMCMVLLMEAIERRKGSTSS
jgi:hypothetical protein